MTTLTKSLCVLIALLFGTLVIVTMIPYPAARADALAAGFSDEEIDRGLRFTTERRAFFWVATGLELAILCVFGLSQLSRLWADRLLAWMGKNRVFAALGMGFTYLIVHEVVSLPLGIWRWSHAREWGMSNSLLSDWLRDRALAFAVNLPWEIVIVAGLYALLILLPRTWWIIAPVGGGMLGMLYAFLLPIVISPLFNTFTPLAETRWKDQQPRVQALVAKAGVPVQEILVMDAKRRSNHTNAYFTGFGSTRSIVLYDTLLEKHDADEIESVLAHELGHWLHNHIVKAITLGAFTALLGLCILDRLLSWGVGRAPWHLRSKADPAALPMILLLFTLGNWVALPAGNLVSRYFERQADQMALDLARRPEAVIACEKKMARDNIINVAPTPWNVWLFSSHPPVVERIRAAKDWEEAHKKKN